MKHNIDLPENCELKFNGNGVEIRVSLNVPKPLVKYVSKNNLHKGNKFYVYSLKKQIFSKDITMNNIIYTYNLLLNRAMINMRNYKVKQLNDNIKMLEGRLSNNNQLTLNF